MISFNKIYKAFVAIFVFIYVFVPLGLLSTAKTLLFIALIGLFIIRIQGYISKKLFLLIILYFVFILLNTLNSFLHGFYEKEILLEAKSLIGYLVIVVILFYSYVKRFISIEQTIKTIITSHSIYIVAKILLIFAFIFNVKIANTIVSYLSDNLGINLIYGSLLRISRPNDLLTPVIFLIILLNRSFLKTSFFKYNLDYFILSLCLINNLVVSFTRFNLIMLILGLFFFIIFIDRRASLYILISILMISLASLALYLYFPSLFSSSIEIWKIRWTTEGALSTNEKVFQYNLFLERISNGNLLNILFGNGIGSFLYDYIRWEKIRYGYEAFIMLLTYQFGFIGIIVILIYYLLFYINYHKSLRNKYLSFHVILSLMLFSVSFVNPMALNSVFAVIYSFIIGNFLYLKSRRYDYAKAQ